jgi:hypothetical protein
MEIGSDRRQRRGDHRRIHLFHKEGDGEDQGNNAVHRLLPWKGCRLVMLSDYPFFNLMLELCQSPIGGAGTGGITSS